MITPEYISKLVRFDTSGNESLEPGPMFRMQQEGSAKIFNLLEKHKIALLADEVGMGKTIQALSVCAALWNEKPDARVLILAPREEVANNWRNEYTGFIHRHYRLPDNNVKSIEGNAPVKSMISCSDLYDLTGKVQQGWGQLFLGKITSFSFIGSKENPADLLQSMGIGCSSVKNKMAKKGADEELINAIATALKKEIDSHAAPGKPFFDLLIIDEAHYFRNIEADSLRVKTARIFFGEPDSRENPPLAERVLLMTATPNHSSDQNIRSVVSYFTHKFSKDSPNEILQKICVRRFRRLSKKGLIKYDYRDEMPSSSNFNDDPLGEMFFGLYQHELAREYCRGLVNPGSRGVSRMMKYLEGIEFIPFKQENTEDEENENQSTGKSQDFSDGDDSHILLDIAQKFKSIFKRDPSHPKYEKLVHDLTSDIDSSKPSEKALIFVRRIASVYEIAKKIIEAYDMKMWKRLQFDSLENISYENLNRDAFHKAVETETEDTDEQDDSREKENSNIPACKVLDLFKKKDSTGMIRSTDASNFKLRFDHSKPSVFGMFFSPGEDYFEKPYQNIISYKFKSGNKFPENYYNSALLARLESMPDKDRANYLRGISDLQHAKDAEPVIKQGQLDTLFTIFWRVLRSDSDCDSAVIDKLRDTYHDFDQAEKEGLSNFIKNGALYASEAVVWFYEIFRKIKREKEVDPVHTYRLFCEKVEIGLKHERIYEQIKDSILNFKTLYSKEFGINRVDDLYNKDWSNFSKMEPIYPYNADNSSQNALRSFNTPFYPDMLVATSVLQEGVNLQYFCSRLYHYGRAWTPGDNEQRTGRIDRMFGKIERNLDEKENSSLEIYYPYLENSIDENQLSRFIRRKYEAERMIDEGRILVEDDNAYKPDDEDEAGWKKFLRKKTVKEENQESDQSNSTIKDPYPVDSNDFKDIKVGQSFPAINQPFDPFYDSICNALGAIAGSSYDIYDIRSTDPRKIMVDPTLRNARKQPVIIEVVIDPVGSGIMKHGVYCLRMRTPLGKYYRNPAIIERFYTNEAIQNLYLPGIKLCLNTSNDEGRIWSLYMAIELPLFISALEKNPLSEKEIQDSFIRLTECADKAEEILFEGQDLKRDDLGHKDLGSMDNSNPHSFRKNSKQYEKHEWRHSGDYLIKEQTPRFQLSKDHLKNTLLINHKYLYIKAIPSDPKITLQVSLLHGDAHKEELELLEKHLEICIRQRKVYSY